MLNFKVPGTVNLNWYAHGLPPHLFDEVWHHLAIYLREEGIENVPQFRDTAEDVDTVLKNPNLLLSQTCGFDIPLNLPTPLQIVAAPIYRASGCTDGNYSSFIVTHQDSKIFTLADLKGKRFAINGYRSYSGFHSLLKTLNISEDQTHIFSQLLVTGTHVDSLANIQNEVADFAAIDRVTWELLCLYRPRCLDEIKIIGQTEQVPAPPFVTSALACELQISRIQRALFRLVENSKSKSICNQVLLTGFKLVSRKIFRPLVETHYRQKSQHLANGLGQTNQVNF